MKILAVALLSLLSVLAFSPIPAAELDYPSLVKTLGCDAPVYTSDVVSPINSFYLMADVMDDFGRVHPYGLYLGTSPDVPADVTLVIVLHETGHCLQHQELGDLLQRLYATAPAVLELDADRRAADMACSLGLEGPALLTRMFEWVNQKYGYTGDENHGSLRERMAMSAHAPACHNTALQAPLQS